MAFANHSTVNYSRTLCAPVRVNPNQILNPNQIHNPNWIPSVSAWTHRRETADEKSACWRWSGFSSPILETQSVLHVRSILKHLLPLIYFLPQWNHNILSQISILLQVPTASVQNVLFFWKIRGQNVSGRFVLVAYWSVSFYS
jgi:hypothetical protein